MPIPELCRVEWNDLGRCLKWPQRHLRQLIDAQGQDAADAGRAAISDDEVCFPEMLMSALMVSNLVSEAAVCFPEMLMSALMVSNLVSEAAVADMMRHMLLATGLTTEVLPIFYNLGKDCQFLMTPSERRRLAGLGDNVTVHRGRMFGDEHDVTGLSWTLSHDVAEAFAVSTDKLPRGWVLTATVPHQAIACLLEERGEEEVIIAPADVHSWTKARGTRDGFPAHMALTGQFEWRR
jgi:hypothetical protein